MCPPMTSGWEPARACATARLGGAGFYNWGRPACFVLHVLFFGAQHSIGSAPRRVATRKSAKTSAILLVSLASFGLVVPSSSAQTSLPSPSVVPVSSSGPAVTLSTTAIDFGTKRVATPAAAQEISLTNTGG